MDSTRAAAPETGAETHWTRPQTGRPVAAVFGASGGIGAAVSRVLRADPRFGGVLAFSRTGPSPIDLADEASVARAAAEATSLGPLRLCVVATGFLHGAGHLPERSIRETDPAHFAHAFAVNATGPALVLKHVLPRLPRSGRATVAVLSARLGSISDNRLGGWFAYRASKAALNQIVRTAAVELARTCPDAACVALHPGTVATPLSAPFAKSGLEEQAPEAAAARLLSVIDRLTPADSGSFLDASGRPIPW